MSEDDDLAYLKHLMRNTSGRPLDALARTEARLAEAYEQRDSNWRRLCEVNDRAAKNEQWALGEVKLRMRYEKALREIRPVALDALNATASSRSSNDYAAFDHISGIVRRALANTEETNTCPECGSPDRDVSYGSPLRGQRDCLNSWHTEEASHGDA